MTMPSQTESRRVDDDDADDDNGSTQWRLFHCYSYGFLVSPTIILSNNNMRIKFS